MKRIVSFVFIVVILFLGANAFSEVFKDIFNKLIFNKIIGLIHRAITQKS